MSILAKAADLIISSYGNKNPPLSRFEIAARACALEEAITLGFIYRELDDETRTFVCSALQNQVIYLACENAMKDSPAFYLTGLRNVFLRLGGQNLKCLHKGAELFTRLASWGEDKEAVHNFIAAARKKAAEQDASACQDDLFKFFLETKIRRNNTGRLRTLFMVATGALKPEHDTMRYALLSLAINIHQKQRADFLDELYLPRYGPDTAEDLFVCLTICEFYAGLGKTEAEAEPVNLVDHIAQIRSVASCFISDLGNFAPGKIALNEQYDLISSLIKSMINPSFMPVIAMGMTRYYLEHHKDKVPPHKMAALARGLEDLYLAYNDDYCAQMEILGQPVTEDEKSEAIRRMFEEIWRHIPCPEVEEIIADMRTQLPPEHFKKFISLIDQTRHFLEPVVSYYAEQDADLSRIRRSMFKKSGPADGQDSFKCAFITWLAVGFSDDLEAAGFDRQSIQVMLETGRIPDPQRQSLGNLSVDHIVDLHCGGTNHFENLALMPERLNRQKNQLVLLQAGARRESQGQGFWVITLRPPRNDLGLYKPFVFVDLKSTPDKTLTSPNPL